MAYSEVDRIATGIPGMDRVLNGGLLSGGIYLVTGQPGTGKTVLANQLCFSLARRGQPSLYVTLLAESDERLLLNQRTLDYYDESLVPDRVMYLNVYQVLEDDGPDGLLQILSTTLKRHAGTRLITVDAVCALEDLVESPRDRKRLIRNIGALASLMGGTVLLLSGAQASPVAAERTMADGVIELSERFAGPRSLRELVVTKFRGSGHLSGMHAFDITSGGIVVYPRLEEVSSASARVDGAPDARVAFGIAGLDRMLRGGVVPGTVTALLGPHGSGRTMLAAQFLAASAAARHPALYVALHESPQRLLAKAAATGIDLQSSGRDEFVHFHREPTADSSLDALAARLLDQVHRRGIRRLVIDGIELVEQTAAYRDRLQRFFTAFCNELRALGATTLVTANADGTAPPTTAFSPAFDNVITLGYSMEGARLQRHIAVLKLCQGDYDSDTHRFEITERGVDVLHAQGEARAS